MLLPNITFKMLPSPIAIISTSSAHYPPTCYLSTPEIIYAHTHTCKHTHLHINLLFELLNILYTFLIKLPLP